MQTSLSPYLPIAVLLAISAFIAGMVLLLEHVLGRNRPTTRKLAPYESAMRPRTTAMRGLQVRSPPGPVLSLMFARALMCCLPLDLCWS